MASSSQHRCVFVGNIPYDATEEQLIEICQEVGPVVSFRLVIDRETGKPKGYGFCEYKDEETALSARRNLQGYEINGRQLRVDFAENGKGADRSQQGRGGPGLASSADLPKQVGGPSILGDSVQHQPIGLHVAISSAAVMAGVLGGSQGQLASANDPLSLHLAKMSRNQLYEIISDMKVMTTQNKELARQLLIARPQLAKALFQAQIILGMVSTQMLQTPNLRQSSGHTSQTPFQDGQAGQLPAVQPHSLLPPLAMTMANMPSNLMPKVQGQVSTGPPTAIRNQFSGPPQLPIQPRGQLPQNTNEQAFQQVVLRGQSLVSPFPPLQPHSSSSLSIQPQIQVTNSSLNPQMQRPPLKNPGQVVTSNMGHNIQMVLSNANIQPSLLPRQSLPDAGYQPGPSISSGISQPISRDVDRSAQVSVDATWARRGNTNQNLPLGIAEKRSMLSEPMDLNNHSSKIRKLDDGTVPVTNLNSYNANGSTPSQVSAAASILANAVPKSDDAQIPGKQISQPQLPSGEEAALLQQVLNLTPEQLISLPPEQQQQVVQLQEMLRRQQIQPP
ncbi:cleavage stimulating factor 64 isoform X2 [Humulus lupulus]|uniref:cleavage stimulating factor 64 isoform X2 n=1 Tax=Humulus lupulus TaxID=3486 RepID=UPI002B403224|nr:cleavage stimulating factor 64 isoform X2 [Humulus lupulus]